MSQLPPTQSDFEIPLPDEAPAWPKVVGIISIVWASAWMLCGVCGLASPLFLGMMSNMVEKDMGPMPPAMRPSLPQMALMAVGLAWAVLLLCAGIATVTRKPSGRVLHLAYAVGALIMVIPSIA